MIKLLLLRFGVPKSLRHHGLSGIPIQLSMKRGDEFHAAMNSNGHRKSGWQISSPLTISMDIFHEPQDTECVFMNS